MTFDEFVSSLENNLIGLDNKIAEGYKIFSFHIWNYSFSRDVSFRFYLLNTAGTGDLLRHEFRILTTVNGEFENNDISNKLLELLSKHGSDFLLVSDTYYYEFVNIEYVKPTITGKYKTNIRITKPIKNITNFSNSYLMNSYCMSYAVGYVRENLENNTGIFSPKNDTLVKDKKILDTLKKKCSEIIENYKNIDLGEITKASIYRNRTSISIENIRLSDGSGSSLDMLPDSEIILKKIVSCLDNDDYILSRKALLVNFKKILDDDVYESSVNANNKHITYHHKKNDIQVNEVWFDEEDFDAMLAKPNLSDELEEKIINNKLLVMLN